MIMFDIISISSNNIKIFLDWPDKTKQYRHNSSNGMILNPKIIIYDNWTFWETTFTNIQLVKGLTPKDRNLFKYRLDKNKPKKLIEGRDYSVSFSGSMCIITGQGNYGGQVRADLNKVSLIPISDRFKFLNISDLEWEELVV